MPKPFVTFCCMFFAMITKAQTTPVWRDLFNEKNLVGWHVSRSSHQGTTPHFYVKNRVIVGEQNPYGQGGILLSDKRYADFELQLDAKIDSFCNSGIFLRATESGQAYQIELAEPGGTGNLLGEMLAVSKTADVKKEKMLWHANGWNHFRVRVQGAVPQITLWINERKMWQVQQPKNDLIGGAVAGFVGLQVHWSAPFSQNVAAFDMSNSWQPGGKVQFKNIRLREIKP